MSEADRYLRRAVACETMAEAALDPWACENHLTAALSWRLLADTLEQVCSYQWKEAAGDGPSDHAAAGAGWPDDPEGNPMSDTKFAVGESVRFQAPSHLRSHYQDGFTITRVLPSERGERQYRIKNAAEAHERVVLESQLAPTTADH